MRNQPRILVVEDQADLADLIAFNLQRAGYESSVASDGQAALERITQTPPDLLILDLMLPRVSGLEVAREIRTNPRCATLPIIMLTARASEADQLAGLHTGADDYITKPFSMKVLLARVEALLRRISAPPAAADRLTLGPIEADLTTHTITAGSSPLQTTLTEFRILAALLRAGGKTMTRLDLMAAAMGPGVQVTARTIDVHMAAIRRKLGPHGATIKTVRGVGYRLVADGEGEPPPGEVSDSGAGRSGDAGPAPKPGSTRASPPHQPCPDRPD